MDAGELFVKLLAIIAAVIVAGLVFLAGIAIHGSIMSNGEIDYCYIEMWSPGGMSPQYQLYGHVPWRSDRLIANYATIELAKEKADALNCKVNSRQK